MRVVALIGALAVGALLVPRGEGIAVLALATAAGVVVPAGLSLALATDAGAVPRLLRRALVPAVPLGAAAGVLGWRAPPGDAAAIACAAVHLAVCALAGLVGLARLWSRRADRFAPLDAFAIDVGLLLLPVGGVWLVASRAVVPLAGFHEPVVTFTAAHFHYAGFAAPVVLGGAGRLVRRSGESRASCILRRTATVVVCAGVPLTAIGIATNAVVERVSAVVLACGMLAASTLLVGLASRRAWPRSRLAAVLFVVSGASLLVTMALAATFALTSSAGRGSSLDGAIPLGTMIALHGGGNAFGFALSGLAALVVLDAVRPGDDDSRAPPP